MNWHQLPCIEHLFVFGRYFCSPFTLPVFLLGSRLRCLQGREYVWAHGYLLHCFRTCASICWFPDPTFKTCCNWKRPCFFITHTIHVWYIYLHFAWFLWFSCREIYQSHGWYGWRKLRKRVCTGIVLGHSVGVRWEFVVYIRLMDKIRLTSWYGKYPHYLQGFIHPRWLFGISEPSTVCLLQLDRNLGLFFCMLTIMMFENGEWATRIIGILSLVLFAHFWSTNLPFIGSIFRFPTGTCQKTWLAVGPHKKWYGPKSVNTWKRAFYLYSQYYQANILLFAKK